MKDPDLHAQLAATYVEQLVECLEDEATAKLWRAKRTCHLTVSLFYQKNLLTFTPFSLLLTRTSGIVCLLFNVVDVKDVVPQLLREHNTRLCVQTHETQDPVVLAIV